MVGSGVVVGEGVVDSSVVLGEVVLCGLALGFSVVEGPIDQSCYINI